MQGRVVWRLPKGKNNSDFQQWQLFDPTYSIFGDELCSLPICCLDYVGVAKAFSQCQIIPLPSSALQTIVHYVV